MRLSSLLAVAAVLGGLAPAGASAADESRWSAPATLPACPLSGPPRVVFPSDMPNRATGPGAIVFDAAPTCAGGKGARVAAIGAGDQPGQARIPRTATGYALALRGPLAVAAGPHGQVLIAGATPTATLSSAATGAPAHGLLIQGRADGPFAPLWSLAGPPQPLALATAYRGDVALASPAAPTSTATPTGTADGSARVVGGPDVGVERYSSDVLAPRASVSGAAAQAISAVSVAMDYRSDALAVWAQGGALYARDLPASGSRHRPQRLAHVGAHLRLATLLSDDNRAIVAWAEDNAGQTSVYVDRSAVGVRFGAPTLLERFADPDAIASPAGSPSLVRLSSESVMLAWAGSAEGHWVVRAAAVDLDGVGEASTISAPRADALLDTLAAGPNDDALALWSVPQPSSAGEPADAHGEAIFAARGIDAHLNRALFAAPEQVAPTGANSDATVAVDPNGDGAVAAWRGAGGELQYAFRGGRADAP